MPMIIYFHRSLTGELARGLIYQGLWEMDEWGSRSGASLSLRELCEGNMEGGPLYWGRCRTCKGRLWSQASLSIGAPLGNMEGGSYTGDFARSMKEGSRNEASLYKGALWGEHAGRAPVLGTPKDMLSKALKMGVCFHRGPLLGNIQDCPFLGPLRKRKDFFIREIFMRNLRDM
jgi:hypothetical protein